MPSRWSRAGAPLELSWAALSGIEDRVGTRSTRNSCSNSFGASVTFSNLSGVGPGLGAASLRRDGRDHGSGTPIRTYFVQTKWSGAVVPEIFSNPATRSIAWRQLLVANHQLLSSEFTDFSMK